MDATPTKDSGLESLKTPVDGKTHIQGTSFSNFLPLTDFHSSPNTKYSSTQQPTARKFFHPHLITQVKLNLHVNHSPKEHFLAQNHHRVMLHVLSHLLI